MQGSDVCGCRVEILGFSLELMTEVQFWLVVQASTR